MSNEFWAGSESSYYAVAEAKDQRSAGIPASSADTELYERYGNVGVVAISGSLVQGDSGWMLDYGITGYDNIRGALLQGLADPEATSILLHIDSGGGSVNGMTDAANLIKQVSAVKPVVTYAEFAASAAYRLAVESSHIMASDSAVLGSIGVLRIHTEFSKADAADGVTRTIFRAGKYKALLNPIEAVTTDAATQEQGKLDYLYGMFVDAVASGRKKAPEQVDAVMAQGREFIGQMGADAGLVDKITTFEQALAYAGNLKMGNPKMRGSATKTLASVDVTIQNQNNNDQGLEMKPTLTPEQIAAIAAGAPIQAELEASTEQVSEAEVTAIAEAAAMKADVETFTSANAELTAEVTTLKEQLTAAKTSEDSLASIVRSGVVNMTIATNGKKEQVATLDNTALVAEHSRLATVMAEKFKSGGVAVTQVTTSPTSSVTGLDPRFAARAANLPSGKR